MKAVEKYLHVALFIILYKVVQKCKFVVRSIHLKAIEQYF